MGKESRVEIPVGSGNFYRYEYDESSGKTLYRGAVGSAPSLSEEEFHRNIIETRSAKWELVGIEIGADVASFMEDKENSRIVLKAKGRMGAPYGPAYRKEIKWGNPPWDSEGKLEVTAYLTSIELTQKKDQVENGFIPEEIRYVYNVAINGSIVAKNHGDVVVSLVDQRPGWSRDSEADRIMKTIKQNIKTREDSGVMEAAEDYLDKFGWQW